MKTRKKISIARFATIIFPLIMLVLSLSSCGKAKEADASSPDKNSVKVYTEVDTLPVFDGGELALMSYIAKNTVYPADAKSAGTQGKVVVKFVVEKDGSVSNSEVLQSVSPSIDAEALRVVNSLPKFIKPGIKDGRPVAVYFMIPIAFKLQ